MKKREDGVEIWKDENILDGKLSAASFIRHRKISHYKLVGCSKCGRALTVNKARAFICRYAETPGGESVHGEALFCSYVCILDWFDMHEMAGGVH